MKGNSILSSDEKEDHLFSDLITIEEIERSRRRFSITKFMDLKFKQNLDDSTSYRYYSEHRAIFLSY